MTMGTNEWHVYVLECEDGYWYVGIARFPNTRFFKHLKGKGAQFTKRHKPINIIEEFRTGTWDDVEANKVEKAVTIRYAAKYGFNKVSGGGYGCGSFKLKRKAEYYDAKQNREREQQYLSRGL